MELMKRTNKLPIFKWFILMACLWAFQASAQQTYKAASCSQTDVQTAINSEIAHAADGDTITIPAGTCTWTGTTPVGGNFTKSVTIQGAGAISATTGGASTTGTDQTVLITHMSNNKGMMAFSTTAGKSLRVTGIAFIEDGSSIVSYVGLLSIGGKSQSVRVDHVHVSITVNGEHGIWFTGNVNGVADHIYINSTQSVTNDFVFDNGQGVFSAGDQFGNGTWAQPDAFGTSQFIYVEDTRFDGGYGSDCGTGGRWVLRNSTAVNNFGMYEHGTHHEFRGCRASEAYNNTYGSAQLADGGMVHPKSGSHLFFNNNVTNFKNVADLDYYRINGVTYGPEAVPPNGWGMCGTVTNGPSVWDQNSGGNGYACLDLPGRGQGDLLTNFVSAFSDILNSATSTRTWPHQALSPVYAWGNTLTGAGVQAIIGNRIPVLTDNVDYYQQFGALGEPGTFNGTAGVGQGSSAPSVAQPTCTPGATSLPAGTVWLGVPISGKWGPGYWNTSSNTLYICTATDTWTAYYKPYTYPHPLTQSTAAAAPAPPTGLVANVQ
jgi:hypothetical protein